MQSLLVNVVLAADLCCYDSAASDTMLTPDARAVLGEVGGNNNSDTCSRHSSASDLRAPSLRSSYQVLLKSSFTCETTRGSICAVFQITVHY